MQSLVDNQTIRYKYSSSMVPSDDIPLHVQYVYELINYVQTLVKCP